MNFADEKKNEKSNNGSLNLDLLLHPFWDGNKMYEESLFFAEREIGKPPSSKLLFLPEKIISLKSADGSLVFEEGKDFTVDKTLGVVQLLPGSKIPSKKFGEMYPPKDSNLPKYGYKKGDPNTFLIFGEGHFFHDMQVSITYTHQPNAWKGYIPQFAGKNLEKTLQKLKDKSSITICLSGDSISAGANASGFTKAPPFLPSYGELVSYGLEKKFGAKVNFKNFAVGGWRSDNGLSAVDKLAEQKPDLVIIAYGMNDSGGLNVDAYINNIKKIIEKVLITSPEVEFILVSSMLPNAEWHYPKLERFTEFRDALNKICGKGVVLADLTSVWSELLQRKSFHDITGNGVNHPNDFGHRIYAQIVLELFNEQNKK